jgi:ADP-heptose:LPS heptosyltransferase
VWSAGRGEDAIVRDCAGDTRYRSYDAGALSLPQLWHLVAKASLLVAPDTGVAHLGRIVGAPTVALFGPGSATINGAGG